MPQSLPAIPLKEFASRRESVLKSLKGAIGLLYAGEVASPLHDAFHADPHFVYLTGIDDEPGAALLLDPTNPVKDRTAMLFFKPLDPELAKWDGLRPEINTSLRDALGFKSISRTPALPRFLRDAARRSKRLACLHQIAVHTQPVSKDLQTFRKVAERIPGCAIEDHTELLAQMRSVKSSAEVRMLQKAVDITAAGYTAVLENMQPGMSEFDIQQLLEHAYKTNGSRGTQYGTIVGSGLNATVLHYRANNQPLEDGQLVCIDSAAGYCGYSADVTRTFPVNGRFTERQREVYDIVLKAQLAAIRAVKPGATFHQIDKAARDIITKAGFADFFIHGIGHHLGLEVHDITPVDAKHALKPGAVITIEPGIYLPDEQLGVRIEDDILVTTNGSKNLSVAIPKKADEIEAAMSR
ncbi:MAG: aminopeptidase P N-terminal domain-containing protein [Phycisphaerales bacterium]